MKPYSWQLHIVPAKDLPEFVITDQTSEQRAKTITGILGRYGDYKVCNGIFFDPATPDDLVRLLEGWYRSNARLTFDFGDTDTGESWGDTYDVSGYIGRTTGTIKSPILVNNKRSMGGPILSTNRILTVRPSNKKHGDYLLYQAPVLKSRALAS